MIPADKILNLSQEYTKRVIEKFIISAVGAERKYFVLIRAFWGKEFAEIKLQFSFQLCSPEEKS